jgi:SnoaL-like protein
MSPDDKDRKAKPDHDATMIVTASMMLPLDAVQDSKKTPSMTMPITPDMIEDANMTMILTPDMVVNDASIVMGRAQIERALAVVGLWHKAVNEGDVETLLAMCSPEIEIIGPRGRGKGHDTLRDWMRRAGFAAVPRRWFCGGEGNVVVEQRARWRDRDGDVTGVISSAFVVRGGKIASHERFEELQTALTMYGLRDVHEVKPRR